ncbi:MAG: MFS transporter [Acidilobaceae archaeon]|nr:MFS transporter [Acidilobaceae archaeon]
MSRHAVSLGAAEDEVSLLATSYALTAIALRFLVSPLIDLGFAKALMIAGGLLSAFSFIIFSHAESVTQLYFGRLVQGVSVALYIPASLYSAAMGNAERATRVIMWRSTMWGMGAAIGPALMGWTLESSSWRNMYYVGSFASFASALLPLSMSSPEVRRSGPRSPKSSLLSVPFLLSSISLLLYVVAYQSLFIFLPALHELEGYPKSGTSLAFTVLAASNLASRILLSATNFLSPRHAAVLGTLLGSGGYAVVALWPLGSPLLLGSALVGIGLGLMVPSLQVISLLGVPQDRRGLAASVYTAMFDVAALVGPPFVIFFARSYEASLLFSTTFAVASFVPLFILRGEGNKKG